MRSYPSLDPQWRCFLHATNICESNGEDTRPFPPSQQPPFVHFRSTCTNLLFVFKANKYQCFGFLRILCCSTSTFRDVPASQACQFGFGVCKDILVALLVGLSGWQVSRLDLSACLLSHSLSNLRELRQLRPLGTFDQTHTADFPRLPFPCIVGCTHFEGLQQVFKESYSL